MARLPVAPDPPSPGEGEPSDTVLAYHERTRHHPHAYARSLGWLDWDSQPDPFRRYDGALLVQLPLPEGEDPVPYDDLYAPDLRAGGREPASLGLEALSRFLRYALSVTAWKQQGVNRWALRANPSSGNLHPTEGYLVLPPIAGLHDGSALFHYRPREHALERRADLPPESFAALVGGLPPGAFLAALGSIPWREAWKYGERAFRYCLHDAGHALASLRFAAAALGWRAVLLEEMPDGALAALLGLDRALEFDRDEREFPAALLAVWPERGAGTGEAAGDAGRGPRAGALLQAAAAATFHGRPNRLSREHAADWPVIESAAAASVRDPGKATPGADERFDDFPAETELGIAPAAGGEGAPPPPAARVLLGRRSAVAFDGSTPLAADDFFRMLARVVPARGNRRPPLDLLRWRPRVVLGLLVHRVTGLKPGFYLLNRDPEPSRQVELVAAMERKHAWERVPGAPPGLGLHFLRGGDVRWVAQQVSCGQEIAADSAFAVAMLADLEGGIQSFGPAFYRRLHWEAGVIGQVLYLEAEALGMRGTGIGCFFDELAREAFSVAPGALASLYHFSVGRPVDDSRLSTLPAYP